MSGAIRSDKVGSDGDAPQARLLGQARSFVAACLRWSQSTSRSPVLRSLSLYPPKVSRYGGWLVVAKVWDDGERKVGFHRASDPLTALLGALTKLSAGTMVLKSDTYTETWNDAQR